MFVYKIVAFAVCNNWVKLDSINGKMNKSERKLTFSVYFNINYVQEIILLIHFLHFITIKAYLFLTNIKPLTEYKP